MANSRTSSFSSGGDTAPDHDDPATDDPATDYHGADDPRTDYDDRSADHHRHIGWSHHLHDCPDVIDSDHSYGDIDHDSDRFDHHRFVC